MTDETVANYLERITIRSVAAPTQFVASPTQGRSDSITLKWAPPTDASGCPGGIEGYNLYRFDSSQNGYLLLDVLRNFFTYTDYGLASGTTYQYEVAARCTGGDVGYPAFASATTNVGTAPTPTPSPPVVQPQPAPTPSPQPQPTPTQPPVQGPTAALPPTSTPPGPPASAAPPWGLIGIGVVVVGAIAAAAWWLLDQSAASKG